MKAFVIIDIQYDFLPGGSLAVNEGDKVIPLINQLQDHFDLIVATQDWHPHNHQSFAAEHPGKKAFEVIDLHGLNQVLWPVHCVQGSNGARFSEELEANKIAAIFRKGMNVEIDSYSGFFDNGRRQNTGMHGFLQDRQVDELYIAGLATDYCVYYTANDALDLGYKVNVIEDASRPIDPENWKKLKKELLEKGANVIQSGELK